MVSQTVDDDSNLLIAQRIDTTRVDMSAAMVKIADLLGERPAAPVEWTITELAKRADVSPATVTRFCRLLGFPGYIQFRVAVASEVGRGDVSESWTADIGRGFRPEDDPQTIARTLLAAHTQALQATTERIDLESLTRVARAIAECRHLDIYGVGGSGVIADELQMRLYRIGIHGHSWSDVHSGLASAVQQTADSVAIGISNTGRTDETLQMLSQAGSVGALTVALTSEPESPLAREADVTLVTAGPGPYLQPDDLSVKHSQLLVVDLIYLITAQQDFGGIATKLAASAMAVSDHRRPTGPPRAARR
ncbi:MurR/RpiR family transcriptional regulator [Microbacterium karelineae]|uniref:MurR/RpiR family transcriptional regulator n=1 Tax=Microbacterium karelineae TaxID=2654283 RepID=UPI0012EA7E5A|nr:MurR/RpiR family transcriptional regulator [Microbacterium karelineae]